MLGVITSQWILMEEIKHNLIYILNQTLSKLKNVCSMNDLAGTWVVKFIGTEYLDINFEMTESN